MINRQQRALEKLAYRYWLRDKTRSPEENWCKALKLLAYIDKRRDLVEKIVK